MSQKEIKYYVYKTTNLTNDKIYIGYHASDNIEKDNYLGSGYLLKKSIDKYGKKNFKREILFEFDTQEEATTKEREIVNEEFIARQDTYNICLGGFGGGLPGELNPFYGKTHTEETRKIISEKNKGREITEEIRQKISKALLESEAFQKSSRSPEKAKKIGDANRASEKHKAAMASPEVRKKISEGITNSEKFYTTMKSEEHSKKQSQIIKNSDAHKIATRSEQFRRVHSEYQTGRSHPWQDKVNKNPEKIEKTRQKHLGSKRTEEQCKNISESLKGKNKGEKSSSFKGYYITPFGKFNSLESASNVIGITVLCIYDRCKVKNNITVKMISINIDKNLTKDMLGKTWKELGWGFEPAERQPGGIKNV